MPTPPAPSYVLTVNGVVQAMLLGFNISEVANGRNRLEVRVRSWTGATTVPLGAPVTLTEDGVRIFGGTVETPLEAGLNGGPTTATATQVSVMDNSQLAERRVLNITLPGGNTLQQWLALLLPYLAPYGVTLDPAQVPGPTFVDPLVCAFMRVDAVLNQLSELTGGTMVWEIDYNFVLRMKEAATTPAPFNVTDGDGNTVGDVTVEPSLTDYGNRILVLAGEGLREVVEDFEGDGTATVFPLHYSISAHRGYCTCGEVNEPVGETAPPYWVVDPAALTITRSSPPGAGVICQFIFTAQFPIMALKEPPGGIYPDPPKIWERLFWEKDVFDYGTAQALADSYYAQHSGLQRTVRYRTKRRGIHPGMRQTITVAARHFTAACLVTEVRIENNTGFAAERLVTAVEGVAFTGTWRDMIAGWNADSATGVSGNRPIIVSGGTGSAVIPTVIGETPAGFIDGANMLFTTAGEYGVSLAVFLNGVRQSSPAHYVETSTNQFTMTSAPLPGDVLRVDYGDSTGVSGGGGGGGGASGTGTPHTLTKWVSVTKLGNSLVTEDPDTGLVTVAGSLAATNMTALGGLFTGNGIGLTNLRADQLVGTITPTVQDNITRVGTITSGVWNASIIGAAYGGTGKNSAAWSGIVTVHTGTWTINDVLTATRLLIAGPSNTVTSDPNLKLVGSVLTVPQTITTPPGVGGTDLILAPTNILHLNPTGGTVTVPGGKVLATTYASGWTGTGYTLNYDASFVNQSFLEVDRLTVRGTMNVYELLIHQIRATNGSIFVANTGKAKTVTVVGGGSYTIDTETAHGFAVNDLIRAQRWTGEPGRQVYLTEMTVTAWVSLTRFTATLRGGTDPPVAGQDFVRLGNTTDPLRQGSIYLTADDTNAPYINVLDGVASFLDWGSIAKTRVRMGNLNGSYGYTSNTYGICMGDNAGAWVKIDPVNGIRIGNATATAAVIPPSGAAVFTGSVTIVPGGSLGGVNYAGSTSPGGIANNSTLLGGTANYAGSGSAGGSANNTVNVGSQAAGTVNDGVTRAQNAISAAYDAVTRVIPGTAIGNPSGLAGLFLGSDNMGYHNGNGAASGWRTYMDRNGNFYLGGSGGSLQWNAGLNQLIIVGSGTFTGTIYASAGEFTGTITATAGYIGNFAISGGNITSTYVGLNWSGLIYATTSASNAVGLTAIGIGGTQEIRFWVGNMGGTSRTCYILASGHGQFTSLDASSIAATRFVSPIGATGNGYSFYNTPETYYGSDISGRLAISALGYRLFWDGGQIYPENNMLKDLGHASFRWNIVHCVGFNTSSDLRQKDAVVPTRFGTDFVLGLRPIDFAWAHNGRPAHGFGAQEIAALAPDFAGLYYDANGVATGLDPLMLLPPLVRAVQDGHSRTTALEARVAALEGR